MKFLATIGYYPVLVICALAVLFGFYCLATTPFSLPYLLVAFTWIMLWGIVARYLTKKRKELTAEKNESTS